MMLQNIIQAIHIASHTSDYTFFRKKVKAIVIEEKTTTATATK